jgi:hypothetical protein
LGERDRDDDKRPSVQLGQLIDQVSHTALVLKREPLAGQVDNFVWLSAKARLQGQLALAQASNFLR